MILLTGATGQLGTALRPLLARRADVATPLRARLDLDDPGGVAETLDHLRPEVVVNVGGWTAVDDAEEHEDAATRANGESVGVMAEWVAAHGGWLLTMSTDYVFDGRGDQPLLEDHPTDPVNAYGRSKLVGEQAALATGRALVVRTSWLVSATHPNFVATMLSLLERGIDPRVVDDQTGCPTVAVDLAEAIDHLVRRRPTGIVHVTNRGETTWFGLAREAARLAGHDPERISPCGTQEYPTPAQRPAWSVLGSTRRQELGLARPRPWQQALVDVVSGHAARRRSAPS